MCNFTGKCPILRWKLSKKLYDNLYFQNCNLFKVFKKVLENLSLHLEIYKIGNMVPATTTSNQIRTVVKRGLSCFDISSPNWELVIGKWPVSRKVIWFTHDQANALTKSTPFHCPINGIYYRFYIVFGINQHVRMSSFQTWSCFWKAR